MGVFPLRRGMDVRTLACVVWHCEQWLLRPPCEQDDLAAQIVEIQPEGALELASTSVEGLARLRRLVERELGEARLERRRFRAEEDEAELRVEGDRHRLTTRGHDELTLGVEGMREHQPEGTARARKNLAPGAEQVVQEEGADGRAHEVVDAFLHLFGRERLPA